MELEFIKPTYSAVKSVNGKTGEVEITADTLGAATVDYVNKTVKEAQIGGDVDLDDYATKDYVDYMVLEVPETTIFKNYYTKDEVEAKYKTYTDERVDELNIDQYALKTDIPEEPDLTPYALKTELPDLTPYALKTDIPEEPDLSIFYDKTTVDEMVAAVKPKIDGTTIQTTSEGELQAALNFAVDDQGRTSIWSNNSETSATGSGAVSLGINTQAKRTGAVAMGDHTQALGTGSFSVGQSTRANGQAQTVLGKYNITDTTSALIIGNGSWGTDNRSNAMTVGFDGNMWLAGGITVGEGENKAKLITANDVPAIVSDAGYQTAEQVAAAITSALGEIGVAEEGAY